MQNQERCLFETKFVNRIFNFSFGLLLQCIPKHEVFLLLLRYEYVSMFKLSSKEYFENYCRLVHAELLFLHLIWSVIFLGTPLVWTWLTAVRGLCNFAFWSWNRLEELLFLFLFSSFFRNSLNIGSLIISQQLILFVGMFLPKLAFELRGQVTLKENDKLINRRWKRNLVFIVCLFAGWNLMFCVFFILEKCRREYIIACCSKLSG